MKRQREDNYGSQYTKTKARTALVVGGIGLGFFGLRELVRYVFRRLSNNYYFGKKEEDRQKKREEEEQQQAEAQRRAEEEDPMVKLKKKDQEVRAYVFSKLGLDQTNTSEGEHVYARGAEEKGYSRPRLVGRLVSMGDRLFVVSEPGVGKSVLAFQMADDIAEGRESKLFHEPEGHQPPQPVYYWDTELDSDDMRERYPEGLSRNLIRFANVNYRDGNYLLKHIYDTVSSLTTSATIVLDNWKALCARIDAYSFLTGLANLQEQFIEKGLRLTVIIVIHTTKEAIRKGEVDLGDVAGSAQITRAAKNVLFVNPTKTEGYVELHDAKHRASKKKKESIVVLRGGVGHDENLHFEALENVMAGEELQDVLDGWEGTKKRPGKFTPEEEEDVLRMYEKTKSSREVVKEFKKKYGKKISHATVMGRVNKNNAKKGKGEEAQDPEPDQQL